MKTISLLIAIGLTFGILSLAQGKEKKTKDAAWKESLQPSDKTFSSSGRTRYFILEPGYQLVLEGKEDGSHVSHKITVLNETKVVDGVETRIVEEYETKDGKLEEVSRNFFAIGNDTKSVYYFGEEVDVYKGDKVVHEGAWVSGVDGAKYGVMIPGDARIGEKYYQERAPKVALDRGENVSVKEKVKTPAGEFTDCLKVKETTPLEPDNVEYKYYAPGVGIVRDGDLKLVKYGNK